MKKYLIDTNALLSFVTDRNKKQQKEISGFFSDAASSRLKLLVHSQAIMEFVYVLQSVYKIPCSQVKEMLKALIETPGIEIVSGIELSFLLKNWPVPLKRKFPPYFRLNRLKLSIYTI